MEYVKHSFIVTSPQKTFITTPWIISIDMNEISNVSYLIDTKYN